MSKILSLIGTMFSNTPESKGKKGELKTSIILSMAKNSQDYTVLDDVTLHTDDNATTQIDHIVISRFGVFVLEVKNYDGSIYGSEDSYKWTYFTKANNKVQFLNPLIQNKKHVSTVQKLLGISDEQIFSIVVFMGKATFKTSMPDNVVQLIDLNRKLRSYQTTENFTEQQCHAFSQKIRNRMLDQGTLAKTVHLTNIEKKRSGIKSHPSTSKDNLEPVFGAVFPASASYEIQSEPKACDISTETENDTSPIKVDEPVQQSVFIESDVVTSKTDENVIESNSNPKLLCPKCQNELVLRTAKKGQNQGKQFYGCSNFPKCRFVLNISE